MSVSHLGVILPCISHRNSLRCLADTEHAKQHAGIGFSGVSEIICIFTYGETESITTDDVDISRSSWKDGIDIVVQTARLWRHGNARLSAVC